VGAGAVFLSRLTQRGILWCLAGCLAWVYGWMLLFIAGMLIFFAVGGRGNALSAGVESPAPSRAAPASSDAEPPAPAAAETPAASSNPEVQKVLDRMPRLRASLATIESYWGEKNERRIYSEGAWWQMTVNRALNTAFYAILFWWLLAWLYLACFLIGIYLTRRGVFYDFERHRPFLRRLLLFGLGVGGVFTVLACGLYVTHLITEPERTGESWLSILAGISVQVGMIPLAVGYLIALLYWSHSGRVVWLQKLFRAVGRMALTNYLMQSVLCGFIFYSYGLGWFDKFGHAKGLAVVLTVWLLELVWSPIWLTFFRMGPVEWAWRSLADGQRKPFLRTAAVP
jgi:uncharacterized membrane protein YeiB